MSEEREQPTRADAGFVLLHGESAGQVMPADELEAERNITAGGQ